MNWVALLTAAIVLDYAAALNVGPLGAGKCASDGPFTPLTNNELTTVNETVCVPKTGAVAGCTECCQADYTCCDDGACMPPDQFCRYPSSCCEEKYCGSQCTNNTGVACGPLWAPPAFTCCNTATGQLCADPDVCCGDHCCPDTHFCCSGNTCCEKGKVCCNGQCCEAGMECCGDHCCLKHEGDVCEAGDSCCPGDRLCATNLCCPSGDFCEPYANTCCDGTWCGDSARGICCHKGSYCNEEFGCCPNGATFCPGGSVSNCHTYPYTRCCSDGSACSAGYPVCVGGGYCCPSEYPHFCAETATCYNQPCRCCGGGGCCAGGTDCIGGWTCQSCHRTGNWFCGHHTVCDNYGSVAHIQAMRSNGPRLKPSEEGRAAVRASKGGAAAHITFLGRVAHALEKKPLGSSSIHAYNPPPAPTTRLNPDHFSCWADDNQMKDVCFAFECMSQMMSRCGTDNYVDAMHLFYCTGINKYRHLFDAPGQAFLVKVQDCMTQHNVAAFKDGGMPCCQTIDIWGRDLQKDCYLNNGFCNVFLNNLAAFEKLFEQDGITNVLNIAMHECHFGGKIRYGCW